MNLLFVSSLGSPIRRVYQKKWGSEMNVLFVSKLSQFARSVFPITKYIEVGQQLGHRVALYGERTNEPPQLPYALDAKNFDSDGKQKTRLSTLVSEALATARTGT